MATQLFRARRQTSTRNWPRRARTATPVVTATTAGAVDNGASVEAKGDAVVSKAGVNAAAKIGQKAEAGQQRQAGAGGRGRRRDRSGPRGQHHTNGAAQEARATPSRDLHRGRCGRPISVPSPPGAMRSRARRLSRPAPRSAREAGQYNSAKQSQTAADAAAITSKPGSATSTPIRSRRA